MLLKLRKWFMKYDKSLFRLSDNGFCTPDAEFNEIGFVSTERRVSIR